MNSHLIITFTILLLAMVLFLSDVVRSDLVALLVLFGLSITGVLTTQEAFSGFSRSAVITIASIFVLAEGLQRTGVTEKFGSLLLRIGGSSESRLVMVVMAAGGILALFMNKHARGAGFAPAGGGGVRAVGGVREPSCRGRGRLRGWGGRAFAAGCAAGKRLWRTIWRRS